jgi:two-component system invasion response regulator UvrY
VDTIHVIIADDHHVIRTGIRSILENSPGISVVGEARNGYEALELVQETEADVLVLDIEMPVLDGLEVTRILHDTGAPTKTLILSAYNDQQFCSEVLKNGASGYLVKDESPDFLVQAVEGVANGQKWWMSEPVYESLGAEVYNLFEYSEKS